MKDGGQDLEPRVKKVEERVQELDVAVGCLTTTTRHIAGEIGHVRQENQAGFAMLREEVKAVRTDAKDRRAQELQEQRDSAARMSKVIGGILVALITCIAAYLMYWGKAPPPTP